MTRDESAEAGISGVVICGAGIAGAACAYFLAHRHGVRDVVIVEEGAPLSLTSDKSTECYRNWWPGPGDDVVRFMNRSIDLLEELTVESDDRFLMNRRGYLFATADPARIDDYVAAASEAAEFGIGELRRHPGPVPYVPHSPDGLDLTLSGADLITDKAIIQGAFPYLSPETVAVLHVRRCGWISAQQLGAYYLEKARAAGARLLTGRVVGVQANDAVEAVEVETADGMVRLSTDVFVNAAGPYAKPVGELMGVDLPLVCERHVKASINDPAGAMGRDAPLIIWSDPIDLPWTDEERDALGEDPSAAELLETYPAGAHGRPTGGMDASSIILYWTYDTHLETPSFPLDWDSRYPEIVLRGMARMLPGLEAYFERMPQPYVDGGYYTKTQENRPLIGPTDVTGAYVCAGFSGFGIMASAAAGELVAAHITGQTLPHYAAAFLLSRYEDPAYQELLKDWPETGQL